MYLIRYLKAFGHKTRVPVKIKYVMQGNKKDTHIHTLKHILNSINQNT